MAEIEYRSLGKSGLMVSTIGLGCNNFGRAGTATAGQAGTTAVVDAAIAAGVTLFDTADIYGAERGLSETLMGHALRGNRDKIVLATKFGMDMNGQNGPDWNARGSRRYIRRAVEGSLRRLQTDWIDLYQLHQPDPNTPIEETLDTLDDLIVEGKVRYIGHSNLAGWQIAEAEFTARLAQHPRFISAQNEYSLLVRDAEDEVLPAVNAYGLGFLPFFPLYNGLLTGKFSRDGGPADSRIMMIRRHLVDDAPWDLIEAYRDWCDERDVTMLAATLAWLLAQPGLSSVIAGATRPEQIEQNADAATAWQPSAAEVSWISDLFA
ncbi:aryl-alcohol dehydrogenase-like predicted oxidoreductase [Cryobacterium sp. MP_M5]|uniref:aldo/keto reductase n=1 Tax=unclassified Cryobacterium TaxID=2649013 RepID=UPI0018CAFE06|nr:MULTISPECIES: aldo/keto reductase [unclassified Cryobacterium]MBG6059573.1 aryl-alcohol dehydrogenase-like predicted oxidoreductase [Cryobacterium sp. MP_M3]MEC5178022.1 aryl-alcohol dehydrogenase-like predicted oxidoreductase [Cryobacterium sp. MP_M5]